jgi:CBS domain-containing protein
LLTRYRVSAFPVLDDDGKVIGVVSEADLLCKEALIAAMGGLAAQPGPYHDDFARAAAVTAADLMTTPPVTITPGEPVTGAARLMYNARVKTTSGGQRKRSSGRDHQPGRRAECL